MANKYASAVIEIAKAEVGYLEKASNKNLDDKTANAGYNNWTKYGKWFGINGVDAYWCCMFVSWCFNKAYGTTDGKALLCGSYLASCETLRSKFKTAGQYKTASPKVGDLIFFSGTRHSGANHIGIVYKVDSSKVYTIEGNTSSSDGVADNGGCVAKKSYALTYSKILGYGRPKYDQETTTTTTKVEESKTTDTIYAIVNTKKDPLVMRKSANKTSAKITTIPKDSKVEVVSKGKSWTKCKYKTYTGYCYNTYLKF